MKYNVILIMMMILVFASCHQQDVDTAFEARNGVYFAGKSGEDEFVALDSVSVSFGLRPAEIQFDTVRVKVTYLGRRSPEVRKFKVKVIEKNTGENMFTDMQEGVHYLPLKSEYEFTPNSYEAIIELIIDRDHFSGSYKKAEEHSLVLQLQESDDFYIGIEAAKELMIKVNNYMAEPAWWDLNGFTGMEKKLGFYHPEKWKALIYINDGFANTDELPFNKRNGIFLGAKVEEARNLNPWWPKIDEEGNRIYFDKIIPANN